MACGFFAKLKNAPTESAAALSVLGPANVSPSTFGWVEGIPPKKIVENLDNFMYLAYSQNLLDDQEYTEDKILQHGIEGKTMATMSLCDPFASSESQLSQRLALVEKNNLRGVFFYEYGKMRLDKLNWIKDAWSR